MHRASQKLIPHSQGYLQSTRSVDCALFCSFQHSPKIIYALLCQTRRFNLWAKVHTSDTAGHPKRTLHPVLGPQAADCGCHKQAAIHLRPLVAGPEAHPKNPPARKETSLLIIKATKDRPLRKLLIKRWRTAESVFLTSLVEEDAETRSSIHAGRRSPI